MRSRPAEAPVGFQRYLDCATQLRKAERSAAVSGLLLGEDGLDPLTASGVSCRGSAELVGNDHCGRCQNCRRKRAVLGVSH